MAEPRKDDATKSVQVEALVSLALLSLCLPTHLSQPGTRAARDTYRVGVAAPPVSLPRLACVAVA